MFLPAFATSRLIFFANPYFLCIRLHNLLEQEIPMSFLIGFLAGFFGGLVGLGGGVILVPLMVGILKLDQHKAHGTRVTARAGAHFAHSLPGWKLKRAFGGFLVAGPWT